MQQSNRLMYFGFLLLLGFVIGWFLFRHKERGTKVKAGIIGAISLPILAYFTLGRMSGLSDSAPPPISIKNFFASYGIGIFDSGENPKSPTGLK